MTKVGRMILDIAREEAARAGVRVVGVDQRRGKHHRLILEDDNGRRTGLPFSLSPSCQRWPQNFRRDCRRRARELVANSEQRSNR